METSEAWLLFAKRRVCSNGFLLDTLRGAFCIHLIGFELFRGVDAVPGFNPFPGFSIFKAMKRNNFLWRIEGSN
jgi:hypothetical protein